MEPASLTMKLPENDKSEEMTEQSVISERSDLSSEEEEDATSSLASVEKEEPNIIVCDGIDSIEPSNMSTEEQKHLKFDPREKSQIYMRRGSGVQKSTSFSDIFQNSDAKKLADETISKKKIMTQYSSRSLSSIERTVWATIPDPTPMENIATFVNASKLSPRIGIRPIEDNGTGNGERIIENNFSFLSKFKDRTEYNFITSKSYAASSTMMKGQSIRDLFEEYVSMEKILERKKIMGAGNMHAFGDGSKTTGMDFDYSRDMNMDSPATIIEDQKSNFEDVKEFTGKSEETDRDSFKEKVKVNERKESTDPKEDDVDSYYEDKTDSPSSAILDESKKRTILDLANKEEATKRNPLYWGKNEEDLSYFTDEEERHHHNLTNQEKGSRKRTYNHQKDYLYSSYRPRQPIMVGSGIKHFESGMSVSTKAPSIVSSDAFADEDPNYEEATKSRFSQAGSFKRQRSNRSIGSMSEGSVQSVVSSSKAWLRQSITRGIQRNSNPNRNSFRAREPFPSQRSSINDDSVDVNSVGRRRRRRIRMPRATVPGAVHMEGRAYGLLPNLNRIRSTVVSMDVTSHSRRRWSRVSDTLSRSRNGGSVNREPSVVVSVERDENDVALAAEVPGEDYLVQATPVSADLEEPSLVYASAESMPTPVKLFPWHAKSILCVCISTLVVFGSIAIMLFSQRRQALAKLIEEPQQQDFPTSTPTFQPTSSFAPTVDLTDYKNILSEFTDIETLEKRGSPQNSAMLWLAHDDKTEIEPDDKMFGQRYAAVVLYFATSEEKWVAEENWLNPSMHECDWGASVACVNLAENLYIYTLDLSKNGLKGTVPPEIGFFEQLDNLYLNDNGLFGTIPNTFGNLASVSVVSLARNSLTGSIPSTINGARSLSFFDLSQNELNGTIPDELYDTKGLRKLDLKFNKLSGTLSPRMEELRDLVVFNAMANNLSGTLPDQIFSISDLAHIGLDYNSFTGELTSQSGIYIVQVDEVTMSNNLLTGTIPHVDAIYLEEENGQEIEEEFLRLAKLDISNNIFSGEFPPNIGFSTPSLKHVDVSHNGFTGSIPHTLSNITGHDNLEILNFAYNSFSGTIPALGHIRKTKYINLSNNKLTGGIPGKSLSELMTLDYLSLDGNSLVGELPMEFGSMTSLRHLYLRDCRLSGSVPTIIGKLFKLNTLDLADNSFTKTIPNEIGNMRLLNELSLEKNELSGTIPSNFGNLSHLKALNIEKNIMTGFIPPEIFKIEGLKEILLSGNRFDGSVPQKACDLLNGGKLKVISVDCDVSCDCCESSRSCH